MKNIICIVCPRSCNLKVDENDDYKVTGHACKRGEEYGKDEAKNPVRTVTATVGITGAMYRRCPVKTKQPIPRGSVIAAMSLLDSVELSAPVAEGDVVVEDICGTGVPWVTSRSLKQEPKCLELTK